MKARTVPDSAAKDVTGRLLRSQDGFALLGALLVLVTVGALMLDHALRARTERQMALHAAADIRARAAARAGLAHLLSRLRTLQARTVAPDPAGNGEWPMVAWNRLDQLVGDLGEIDLGEGERFTVRVRDVSSRLPLNEASEDELRNLFLALGAEFREADIAAQSILDWRDPDDLYRPRGAEWTDHYRHQDPPIVPRNGPFASLEELRRVRGMAALYDRVAEHLTVVGDGRVNLNTAAEPVLRALPGMTDEAVAAILVRRSSGQALRSLLDLEASLSPPAREALQQAYAALVVRASFEPQMFEISVTGSLDGSPLRRAIEAVAVRAGSTVQLIRSIER